MCYKHDDKAKNRAEKTEPHVVILEGGSETGRFGERGVEARKINQTIGGQKEIGDYWCDRVEVSNYTTRQGYGERQYVTSSGLVILAEAFAEILDVGKQLILTESLKHFGCTDQTGQSWRKCGSKYARVY